VPWIVLSSTECSMAPTSTSTTTASTTSSTPTIPHISATGRISMPSLPTSTPAVTLPQLITAAKIREVRVNLLHRLHQHPILPLPLPLPTKQQPQLKQIQRQIATIKQMGRQIPLQQPMHHHHHLLLKIKHPPLPRPHKHLLSQQ
jgi:hypothetical protein